MLTVAGGYRCKHPTCDHAPFATLREVAKHYKDDHPGEKSPRRGAPSSPPTEPAGVAPGLGAPDPDPGEIAPEIPTEIRADLEPLSPVRARRSFREWIGLQPKRDKAPRRAGERAPSRKREFAGDLIGTAWAGAGTFLARTGLDVPVGNTLKYQQPIAGEVLDSLWADTRFDRAILQPLARNADNAEAIVALGALPALVFLYERVPDEAKVALEPYMESAIRAHLVAMAPVIKKKRARDRELDKVIEDLREEGMIDPEIGNASDAVNAILHSIFTSTPPAPPAAAPEPEAESA